MTTHLDPVSLPTDPEEIHVNDSPRRRVPALATGLVLGAALWGAAVAPAAYATEITNPADHPAPVTVKIDGQVYHDGLDTLPGFDDYACTPIPGVEYDFAGNQTLYYDSDNNLLDTAKWTEWSRITSYQTWLAQQKGASTTKPSSSTSSSSSSSTTTAPTTSSSSAASDTSSAPAASTTTSAATSAPAASSAPSTSTSAPAASSSGSSAATTTKRSSKSTAKTSKSKDKDQTAAAASAGDEATTSEVAAGSAPGATTPSKHHQKKADDDDASATTPAAAVDGSANPPAGGGAAAGTGAVAGTAAVAGAPVAKSSAKAVKTRADGAGNTRAAGLAILAVLALGGLVLLFGNFARRQAAGLHRPGAATS